MADKVADTLSLDIGHCSLCSESVGERERERGGCRERVRKREREVQRERER